MRFAGKRANNPRLQVRVGALCVEIPDPLKGEPPVSPGARVCEEQLQYPLDGPSQHPVHSAALDRRRNLLDRGAADLVPVDCGHGGADRYLRSVDAAGS